jgi:GrpB-like predicted nucleotidyltransferase (UPF0157 family)
MVTIVEADPGWASDFQRIGQDLHAILRMDPVRIDHIGSTSVPGLASKNVIDIQVSVRDEEAVERVAAVLDGRGWRRQRLYVSDHHVADLPEDGSQWRKVFFDEPEGDRAAHLHVRIEGRANQRYALLFRDFLRAHPESAAAYAQVKRDLAALSLDSGSYADAKDPACDLIYLAAERWAEEIGWVQ